jgi:hypothetical protein
VKGFPHLEACVGRGMPHFEEICKFVTLMLCHRLNALFFLSEKFSALSQYIMFVNISTAQAIVFAPPDVEVTPLKFRAHGKLCN